MNSAKPYDVIIIGAGPIGLACALEAKKASLQYLVIEKGALVNSIYNYPSNMTFFSTSERLEIGAVPFVSNNPKPSRPEAMEYYRRVSVTYQLAIHLYEEVLSVQDEQPGHSQPLYKVTTSKDSYLAKNIIVATGFYDIPYLLNVPGEDLPKVTHYYKEPHPYAFQRVLVVGAQNSSVDAALETWRKGAEVTMVVRKAEIGTRVKYWVRPDILNRIAEGSIKAYFNSSIVEIKKEEVIIQTPEGLVTLPNDWVIATTGYQPNLAFLRKIGIALSDDSIMCPAINEETHETNVRNVFLAGVICGGMNTHRLFIENSREHAVKIIEKIKNVAAEAFRVTKDLS
ncbi:MAG TPA: YpdA family putative bacillithiol disulfide reductase [Chitinophagaceae bacterium]|nr:YpdA family putative bacillithiol disulfide reductase [Chitinophagaceae bacterium]